jgi:hypothetical protein
MGKRRTSRSRCMNRTYGAPRAEQGAPVDPDFRNRREEKFVPRRAVVAELVQRGSDGQRLRVTGRRQLIVRST